MSIDVGDFLSLAREIVKHKHEVCWRTATGRAYYAAYHASLIWHDELPLPGSADGRPGGAHQKLLNMLFNPAPENTPENKSLSKVVSISLGSLRNHRHEADYNLEHAFEREAALNVIARADMILEKLGYVNEAAAPVVSSEADPDLIVNQG